MFDVGFWEVALLGVLALLILGPERLPRALRVLGFWVGRARAMYYSVRSEMDREFQIQEMRKAGRDFEAELNRSLQQDATTPPPQDSNSGSDKVGTSSSTSPEAAAPERDKGADA